MSTKKSPIDIHEDPTIKGLLKRIPDVFDSNFTDEQLAGLKVALSSRSWRKHPIHFRKSIGLVRWRYYFVLIAGKELRSSGVQNRRVMKATRRIALNSLIIFMTVFFLFLIYIIKSALGINVFPNFSLGIWQWFESSILK